MTGRAGLRSTLKRGNGWIRAAGHLVRTIALLLGFTVAAVTFLPILQPWINSLTGPWTQARGDILVVLGNETSPDHLVGLKTYWRCVYAVLAWREGGFREIVVSGGGGISEAMRDFLVGSGVPAGAIREESKSLSTRENALFVSEMLGRSPGRVVLLTSDFHMFRAYRAFRKCGLDVLPRPFPDAGKNANSPAMRWPVFLGLLQETVKIVGYRVRGWI
jgi:uncharacterized SAM-binding protein YcdF (DUF218 family)